MRIEKTFACACFPKPIWLDNEHGNFLAARVRVLSGTNARAGRPVLCFVSRALRAWSNPALDFAVQMANEQGMGLWVLVVLDSACPRAFRGIPRFFSRALRIWLPGCV
jgi:hypothetical protein